MIPTLLLFAAFLLLVAVLALRRAREVKVRDLSWAALAAKTPWTAPAFDPAMVESLPEAARRYLGAAIAPGTPLKPVAELRLAGTLAGAPAPRRTGPVRAYLMLAPPFGSMLRLYPAPNPLGISGSIATDEAGGRARFWLAGLIPLRAGPPDAAAARLLVEAALWCPAALMPGCGATWEAVDADTALVSMPIGQVRQRAELRVARDGRLASVRAADAGLAARPADFRDFEGYCLPASVTFEQAGPAVTPRISEARIRHVRFIGPWPGSRRS